MPNVEASKTQKASTTSNQRLTATDNSPESATPAFCPTNIVQRARIEPKSLTPPEVMYLQRTVGNRATQQILGRQTTQRSSTPSTIQRTPEQPAGNTEGANRAPSDQAKLISTPGAAHRKVQKAPVTVQRVFSDTATSTDWTQVEKVKPSSDGAKGGVMFVSMKDGKQHIIKGVRNAGAVIFAEELVGEISGAETTQSIPIRNSKKGESKAILDMLSLHKGKETDPKMQMVWERNLPVFQNAPFLMIQKVMSGSPMDQVREENPMALLGDPKLLEQMGRTLAADTLIGNADRFEGMNTGNAFLTQKGNIGAIDTEAILQSHQAFVDFIKREVGEAFGTLSGDPVTQWVTFLVGHPDMGAGQEISGTESVGAPSSNPREMITNFDHWFKTSFKYSFEKYDDGVKIPKDFKWESAKASILIGFKDGLGQIQSKFSGKNYETLTKRFSDLEAESGITDLNFNLEALKVKANYMTGLGSGLTHDKAFGVAVEGARPAIAVDEAVAIVTNAGDEVTEVFGRPSELTGKQKGARAFSFAKNTEKQGKALKKLARRGSSDPKLEGEVREAVKSGKADRSAQKAIYEISINRFIKNLQLKAAKLAFLDDVIIRGKGAKPGLQGDLTGASRLKQLLDTGARRDIWEMGNKVTIATEQWLATLKPHPDEDEISTRAKKKLNSKLTGWQTMIDDSYTAFHKSFNSFTLRTK